MKSQQDKTSFRALLKSESKDISIYTFSTFLNRVGTFILFPWFWKRLTPGDYGVLAVIDMIGSIFMICGTLSLEQSINRFYYEWPESERRKKIGAIWMLGWFASISVGIVFIFFASFASHYFFPEVEFYPYIFIGLISVILTSLTLIPICTIRIKRIPWLYFVYNLFYFLLSTILSIYYVLILDKGLYGLLIGRLWSDIIIVAGCTCLMFFFAKPCLRNTGLSESLKYSLPIIPSLVISNLTAFVDRFLLQKYASVQALGIYSLSQQFANIINLTHNSLKMNYGPFVMKTFIEDKIKGIKNIVRITPFYMMIYFAAGLLISLFIKEFVYFVNQPKYFPIVTYVPFVVGISIIGALYVYYAPGIGLAKRNDLLWIPQALRFVVVIIMGFIFIKKYQIWGIVITRYLSSITFLASSVVLSNKVFYLPHRWTKLFSLVGCMTVFILLKKSLYFENLFNNILINMFILSLFMIISTRFILAEKKAD